MSWKKSPLGRVYVLLRGALAVLGLAVVLGHVTPAGYWYAERLGGAWKPVQSGTIFVLAADIEDGTVLGVRSLRRTYYAWRKWQDGGGQGYLVVLGTKVGPLMKQWLMDRNVPEDRILTDDNSLSTWENGLAAVEMVRQHGELQRPFVLMTSDFHMYRAGRVFARLGLTMEPQPVPDVMKRWPQWQHRWVGCMELAEETAKIVYYRWKGRI
jgi:uncharacterized SAM-binding protein YcdF (DUF218 family)